MCWLRPKDFLPTASGPSAPPAHLTPGRLKSAAVFASPRKESASPWNALKASPSPVREVYQQPLTARVAPYLTDLPTHVKPCRLSAFQWYQRAQLHGVKHSQQYSAGTQWTSLSHQLQRAPSSWALSRGGTVQSQISRLNIMGFLAFL